SVISDVGQNPVRSEDLERVKTQLIAEAIYAQDNQATLARWYGGALTTGLSIDDIRSWPDRIRAVTAEQVRDAAQKWLEKMPSAAAPRRIRPTSPASATWSPICSMKVRAIWIPRRSTSVSSAAPSN